MQDIRQTKLSRHLFFFQFYFGQLFLEELMQLIQRKLAVKDKEHIQLYFEKAQRKVFSSKTYPKFY